MDGVSICVFINEVARRYTTGESIFPSSYLARNMEIVSSIAQVQVGCCSIVTPPFLVCLNSGELPCSNFFSRKISFVLGILFLRSIGSIIWVYQRESRCRLFPYLHLHRCQLRTLPSLVKPGSQLTILSICASNNYQSDWESGVLVYFFLFGPCC